MKYSPPTLLAFYHGVFMGIASPDINTNIRLIFSAHDTDVPRCAPVVNLTSPSNTSLT
ncbi:hypothetical protein PILCRDRAFT_818075 [Piloderma croceum F 1598]|uniref:Uncharacterized protein n=1 Tax=Piloderma croceum (strain F 1598) TaxID=765440 RepID=A0A0C3G1A0_PILCF|nr:hypothetical protein PILCRDRAFT_818075 [Piloderma croceum F 1598]